MAKLKEKSQEPALEVRNDLSEMENELTVAAVA
jgi:hypothetical protein